jgi:MFS family permease
VGLGLCFYFLLIAHLLVAVAGFLFALGRSLVMGGRAYTAMAISSTAIVGALVGMPLPFVLGWLSDRKGRRVFLYFSYFLGIGILLPATAIVLVLLIRSEARIPAFGDI